MENQQDKSEKRKFELDLSDFEEDENEKIEIKKNKVEVSKKIIKIKVKKCVNCGIEFNKNNRNDLIEYNQDLFVYVCKGCQKVLAHKKQIFCQDLTVNPTLARLINLSDKIKQFCIVEEIWQQLCDLYREEPDTETHLGGLDLTVCKNQTISDEDRINLCSTILNFIREFRL